MKKYKFKILILIGFLLLTFIFSNSLFTKAETITISGIKANDFFRHEPNSYEEVEATLMGRPAERTGYSGKLYSCINGKWVQRGTDINTDDSGRDKRYNVADYRDQIIKLYDEETYKLALASGESLVFDPSKGKKEIYSSGNSGTKLPCKDGDNGYFYNNLDFWLTLTFTKPDIQPPPSKESVRIEPSERIVEVGQTESYKLYHYDNNGNKTDVTDAATWSISSDKIGKSAGKGSFEGLSVGSTSVKATYKTFSDSASFKVIEAKAKPEVTIHGPTQVKAGDEVGLFAAAHVEGGTIDRYIWDHPDSSGGNAQDRNLNRLYYMTEGFKYVSVAVEDNFNQWAYDDHIIEVLPPVPVASVRVDGTLKENRKVIIDGSVSSSPTHFPIVWSKSYMEITPKSGQKVSKIKYSGSLMGVEQKDVLFKEPGMYEVKIYVENTAGLSDSTTKTFTITPDLPPVANFNLETKAYREPEDSNNASVTLSVPIGYDESKDNDIIKQRIWKYRYDSNNDGNFEEEPWVILDQSNKTSILFKSKNVGRYEFSLEIVEEFGQPTILEFIVPSDYRRDDTSDKNLSERQLLIDNRAPSVQWGL